MLEKKIIVITNNIFGMDNLNFLKSIPGVTNDEFLKVFYKIHL